MTTHRPLLAAALIATTGLSLATVSPAHAATLGGNPVPGLCMLSREAVFAQSKVGQAANDRLKSLAQQQQQSLESQRKPLEADVQAFRQKASTLTEAQRQQQG